MAPSIKKIPKNFNHPVSSPKKIIPKIEETTADADMKIVEKLMILT